MPELKNFSRIAIRDLVKSVAISPDEKLASSRHRFYEIHDFLMSGCDRFEAWFQETGFLEAEIEGGAEELRQCVADIKKDWKRYNEIIAQVCNIAVAEFSLEELAERTGKASLLLDLAGEIISMESQLPGKIEKLHFLLDHPSQ